MDIILIPGLWLDGSTWDKVLPTLDRAGHRTHALTLPGMDSPGADRSKVTVSDCVAAVVEAIDRAEGRVVLVGHSAGAALACAAVDARPDRVAQVLYLGGFPVADGAAVAPGAYPDRDGEIPLPDWSAFEDEDLADLDEAGRAEFRARAVPSPACIINEPIPLTDERRYDVPAVALCPEYSAADLRSWIAGGAPPVQEFTKIHRLTYVDVPTGHWPQFTKPEQLGTAILAVLDLAAGGTAEPPVAADETAALLGALERNRGYVAWKCGGLDAAGLRATLPPSTITLGGLVKHLALVEDDVFARRFRGTDRAEIWRGVDWTADPDWDWHSAAEDTPEQLFTLWRDAVARSRAIVATALASPPGDLGGLDQPAQFTWPDGRTPNLRRLIVDLIEEYARHVGHADLIRESVDGLVGEDPRD